MNPPDERLRERLAAARNIAVVGLSPRMHRTSHRIGAYLQEAGYRIFPVNPNADTVLGETARGRLADLEEPIDIVNVFRRNQFIPRVAEGVLRMSPRPSLVWMQLGIFHEESARKLEAAGIEVVQDLCIKVEHRRLLAGP
ncbi:MAG: CoA-binding protein [bacterium]|nr:CoA-binding protein [bacterium]